MKNSYPEWWRDWPNETRQPAFNATVLIPADLNLKDERKTVAKTSRIPRGVIFLSNYMTL